MGEIFQREMGVRETAKLFVVILLIAGCASPGVSRGPALGRLALIPIGTEKADVLKAFGAPSHIELEQNHFRYTYFRGPARRVVIVFDQNNRVASIIK